MLANEWDEYPLLEYGVPVWETDMKEPNFDELTEENNKPPTVKITFSNESDLLEAEHEILNIVSKYEKAFYSVSSEK